jgi:Rrf2 family protein
MRLRFSRTADYGLRAALEVARARDDDLVTRHALAEATDAPPSVLAQALAALVRAGLLDAQAGPRGGYRLARQADDLSIHDVLTAIDPEESEPQCVLRETRCSATGLCPFHPFLADAQERFLDALRATSLADVIAAPLPPVGAYR